LALTPSVAVGAQPAPLFQDFTSHTWHIQDGLPDQVIQALVQTPDHYLWIGTSKGLLRFDGRSFLEYNGPEADKPRADGVYCLLVARDGSLWAGTEGAGVLHYSNGEMHRYSTADGLTNPFVKTLHEDSMGALWVGTDFGLFKRTGERFVRVDDAKKFPNFGVHAITEDRGGAVWAGGSRLVRYLGPELAEYKLPKEARSLRIKAICQTEDGTLWIGTVAGLYRQGQDGIFVKVNQVTGSVRALTRDAGGRLWTGTIGNGVFVEDHDTWRHLLAPEILPSNTVLSMTQDLDGNMWIGTQAGLLRLSRSEMQIAALPGTADADFGTGFRDTDGAIWICSTHLFRIRNGVIKPYAFPGLADTIIRTMLRDRTGVLWLGTMGQGIFRVKTDGSIEHTTVGNDYIREFYEAWDGAIWIGTDGGVTRYKDGVFTSFHEAPGAPKINITSLWQDPAGQLLVGTPGGLKILRNGRFVNEPMLHPLTDQAVWALHQGGDGALWVGAASGLYRWKDRVLHHIPLDLSTTPSVYGIMEDASGSMWISGPTTALKIQRENLVRAAESDSPNVPAGQLFAVSSEIPSAELYGGMQPAGVLGADGTAWYPTSEGVLHITPRIDAARREPPPVVIQSVFVDGREAPAAGQIQLPPGSHTLRISYAPILLGSQSRLRFRRRLRGFDQDWSKTTEERTSTYTNLVPGKYVYEVEAFFADDPPHVSRVSLSLQQRAHFYSTREFLLVCAFLAGLGVLLIDRFRAYQMRSRFLAVTAERSRVAREIHDTVIQGCTGVSVLLEAFSSLPDWRAADQRQLVNVAREQVKQTIDAARDAVWDLRHADHFTDYTAALRKTIRESIQEFSIPFQFHTAGAPRNVDPAVAYESFMATREAVRNAAIHGHPSAIQVSLTYAVNRIQIRISDNGCGFASEQLASSGARHYGLLGMRERVERVGGSFTLRSEQGDQEHGTHLNFDFPVQVRGAKANRPQGERSEVQ
jgi:ligand-binding sensor domain-containing protein/signal transduction histidine kinase